MQQILILRHATPEPWLSEAEDFSRTLSEAGRKQAVNIANWIDETLEMPEEILCSPAQRTRETLAPLLCLHPTLETCTRFVPQAYGASRHTLSTLLDAAFCEADNVLIVGHNPGIERLALDILAPAGREQVGHVQTGTLLVVEFQSGWPDDAGNGVLRHRIRAEES